MACKFTHFYPIGKPSTDIFTPNPYQLISSISSTCCHINIANPYYNT